MSRAPRACALVCGQRTPSIAAMACPPSHDWMPNHPQATSARRSAGMFAPTGAERCAHEDREWNAVLCAGMRVEQHRDEHDQIAEKDGEDRLLPVHASGDERRRQHVGRDLHRHREPERDVVVGAPGARAQVGWARGLRCRGVSLGASSAVGTSSEASGVGFALDESSAPCRARGTCRAATVLSTTSSPREKTLAALPFTFQPSNME